MSLEIQCPVCQGETTLAVWPAGLPALRFRCAPCAGLGWVPLLARAWMRGETEEWKDATLKAALSPVTGRPLRYPEAASLGGPWTRSQLAARIHVLREALDLLADQAGRDTQGLYACTQAMRVNLAGLEGALLALDSSGSSAPRSRPGRIGR